MRGGAEGWGRGAALVTGLICLGAAPGRLLATDAGDVALEYRVPADCPDERTFRERAADLFDFRDPFVPAGAKATTNIRVDVTHDVAGYHGRVIVYNPANGDTYRMSTEDHRECDNLAWILSHRVGMIIEKTGRFAIVSGKPAAPVKDEATQRRLDAMEEAIEDQRDISRDLSSKMAALQKALDEEKKKRKMDLTYALSAGALITANLTSNVGPGAWVGGELRTGPIGLGLELRAVIPSQVVLGPYDFDFSRYVALLTPCGRYSYFFGCVVAGAGAQLSYDSNFPGGSKSAVDPFLQLGGRIGVDIPFGDSRFGARAWGEVLYGTPTVQITIDPYMATIPEVSAFFGVGLVVRFGKDGE